MADYQSSYTGAQLDAAIASYANRTTGQIILTPDVLTSSLSDGYYSGVSASFDYSNLTAESSHVLSGKSAVGKYGKITNGGMQSGNVSLILTPSNLSPSTSPNKYVPSASASLDYSPLTAEAAMVQLGKTFIGKNGVGTGSLTTPQFGSFDTGSNTPTSYTISGLTGTPTNIIIVRAGWQGRASNNNGALRLFLCVPGTVDRYHYCIIAFNTGTTSSATDYNLVADTAVANCVSWNRSNNSVTVSLPLLRVSDSGTRNKQGFFRQHYSWIVW